MFKAALAVMGDLYASALGTSVLQLQDVPPQPANWLAGDTWNPRPYFERGWVSNDHLLTALCLLPFLLPPPSLPPSL